MQQVASLQRAFLPHSMPASPRGKGETLLTLVPERGMGWLLGEWAMVSGGGFVGERGRALGTLSECEGRSHVAPTRAVPVHTTPPPAREHHVQGATFADSPTPSRMRDSLSDGKSETSHEYAERDRWAPLTMKPSTPQVAHEDSA
ncbi:hypothetical protein ACLOJK_022153 [Asimina triloba]